MKNLKAYWFLMIGLLLFGLIVGPSQSMAYSGEGQKDLILKSGTVSPPKETMSQTAIKFAERLKKRTNGKIQITHYADSQLGKEQQMLESIKTGAIAMMVTGTGASKVFENINLPYLFRDGDHAMKVLEGAGFREQWAKEYFEKTGVLIFDWVYRGFRHCTFSKTPVRTAADVKGMKLRVPSLPIFVETWQAVGARPTPVAGAEMYLALRQGVVDGQENPLDTPLALSLWEVQKYLVLTGHVFSVGWPYLSGQVWQNLTPETRKVWLDTWKEVAAEMKGDVTKIEQECISTWKSKGGVIIEPDVESFREATKEVWKKFAPQVWGQGVYEKIKAIQ